MPQTRRRREHLGCRGAPRTSVFRASCRSKARFSKSGRKISGTVVGLVRLPPKGFFGKPRHPPFPPPQRSRGARAHELHPSHSSPWLQIGPGVRCRGRAKKALGKVDRATWSHARMKIIRRSASRSYPISSLRPVPDVPAGPVCSKGRIGPNHKIWRREPPASLQAGRRGATTGFAPPVTAQGWTCIEHGRPRARFPAAKSDAFHSLLEMDPASSGGNRRKK